MLLANRLAVVVDIHGATGPGVNRYCLVTGAKVVLYRVRPKPKLS